MEILALDVGTTESGFCVVDENYNILKFGKWQNESILELINESCFSHLIYEKFECYGMPIGQSTINAIEWNGRFKQLAISQYIEVDSISRKEEKLNLCNSLKAKDSNIRLALIDRFAKHDLKNGKGTKKNPDTFYGFAKDMWSAFAIAATYLDKKKKEQKKVNI